MNLILLLIFFLNDVALSYINQNDIKTALTNSQVLGTVQSLARIRSILLTVPYAAQYPDTDCT
jgi:hypothetical protein